MTVEEVMQYRRAEPFRPFVLRLKDGREFVVKDALAIGRDPNFKYLMVGGGRIVPATDIAGVRLVGDSAADERAAS